MAKTIRMADIANRLGISVVTVSKALNGKDGVGSKLRSTILDTADEMGYVIKQPGEKKSDSFLIGIINSYLYLEKGSSFYWSLYEKLIKNLSSAGDLGVLEVISADAEEHLTVPKIIRDKRVDGIIVMGPFPDEYIKMLDSLGIPMVLLDSFNSRTKIDTVISDGYYGMYQMVDYLIQQGHRDIMFVGTVGETSSITDRFYGYCRAMTDAGIKVTDDMIIPDRNEIGKIKLCIPPDINQRATALACNCDFTAYEAVNKLIDMNIKVPEDISIIGFDNYILSEMSPVKITTYEVKQDEMAYTSAKQIRARIKNPEKPHDVKIINGNILIRDSVKSLI